MTLTVDGVLFLFVAERSRRSVVPSIEITDRVQMPEPNGRSWGKWEWLCYMTRGVSPLALWAIELRMTDWAGHALTTTGEVPSGKWVDPSLIAAQMMGGIEAVAPSWHAIARKVGVTPRYLLHELDRARAQVRANMAMRVTMEAW